MRIVNSDGELVEYNKDKDAEMMKAVQVGIVCNQVEGNEISRLLDPLLTLSLCLLNESQGLLFDPLLYLSIWLAEEGAKIKKGTP